MLRFWGDDELDRLSVTSRKMVTYTRVDCVGASKVSQEKYLNWSCQNVIPSF